MRILTAVLIAAVSLATASARAQTTDPADWDAVRAEARGQTVYFHAWGARPASTITSNGPLHRRPTASVSGSGT
jgi:ABC-type uncharacterized transport system YnjBCD substrate-binding protein